MHRSGTLLLTSILVKMGCYPGPAVGPADRWNAGGYWEHPGVLQLDMDLFKALGANWYDVGQVHPNRLEAAVRRGLEDRAVEIVRELDDHRPWVIKDPRLCVLFPFWRPLLQQPIALLIHRDPVSIARSLSARDGFPLLFGIALWEHHIRSALAATAGLPRILVSHRELTTDLPATIVKLHRQLIALGVDGLSLPAANEIGVLFRPALNHYQPDPPSRHEYLNAGQLELLESLESAQVNRENWSCSGGAQDLIHVYARRQSEQDSLAERLGVLTAAQIRLTSEVESLGAAREALQQEHDSVADQLRALVPGKESLAAQVETLLGELAALGAARDALRAEKEQMARERDAEKEQQARERHAEKEQLAREQQAEKEQFAREYDADKEKLTREYQAERKRMAHQLDLLAQRTDSLGARVQALLAERDALDRKNRDLSGEFAAMAAERRDLRSMLETWQQRMAFVESTRVWRTRERVLRVRRYLERLAGQRVDPGNEPAKRGEGS